MELLAHTPFVVRVIVTVTEYGMWGIASKAVHPHAGISVRLYVQLAAWCHALITA